MQDQAHANAAGHIAHHILAYLATHPKAHDTLEGILEWWLLEQYIRDETRNVKDGLAILLSRGFIQRSTGGDARLHYSLDPTRLDEIADILRAQEKQNL